MVDNRAIQTEDSSIRFKTLLPDLSSDFDIIKKWKGNKVKDLNEKDITNGLIAFIMEVMMITGTRLHDKATKRALYDAQVKVISKFITVSFPLLSFDEMIIAFYMNSAGRFGEIISNYGKELSIEFMGRVLNQYTNYKKDIVAAYNDKLELFFNGADKPTEKIWTDEDYLNENRMSVEQAYQRFIKDLDLNEELFPEYFYATLVQDGFIPENRYEEKLKEAKEKIAKNKQIERMYMNAQEDKQGDKKDKRFSDTTHISKTLEHIRKLVQSGNAEKYHPIVTVSKQIIVKEFFLSSMNEGKLALYKKVE